METQKDILFTDKGYIYSHRVGGILIHNGNILLQRPKNDNYSIIGGHIKLFETSEEALKREFEEELHTDIEIDGLIAVGEIFFPWDKTPCHQLALYYKVHLTNRIAIPLDGMFQGYDNLGNRRFDLDFCWLPLAELKNNTIYPQELIPIIMENRDNPKHFVSKQLL